MKRNTLLSLTFTLLLSVLFGCTQKEVPPPEALLPVPTERQLAWHEMEQYAFVHFTTNTFTDKEWGFGDESPDVFNPTAFNAEQWVKVIKDAGLKALILTCKHHDGFCLWPSKFTEHSVKNSKWMDGNGDVVKAVSDACKKHNIKFGVYLSPWDRNHAEYGSPEYVEYYRNQLKEIFTAYGPAFEMWFDGANGGDGYYGGANEKRKIDGRNYYDWPTTLKLVRGMEPQVIFFSDAGPDIRWCGNESGYVKETNWCTIDRDTIFAGKPGISKLLNTGTEGAKDWMPAEVDVSIRPGWFYHATEDEKVRTPENLFDIYLTSVGRGSNLLLNIPPDRRGLIHENDIAALQGWKKLLDERFATNYAQNAKASADLVRGDHKNYAAANAVDGDKNTYWATNDEETKASINIELDAEKEIKYVVVQEYIQLGQRVKAFEVEAKVNGEWEKVATSTTIGYKKILQLETPVKTDNVRISITDSRACPVISNIEIY